MALKLITSLDHHFPSSGDSLHHRCSSIIEHHTRGNRHGWPFWAGRMMLNMNEWHQTAHWWHLHVGRQVQPSWGANHSLISIIARLNFPPLSPQLSKLPRLTRKPRPLFSWAVRFALQDSPQYRYQCVDYLVFSSGLVYTLFPSYDPSVPSPQSYQRSSRSTHGKADARKEASQGSPHHGSLIWTFSLRHIFTPASRAEVNSCVTSLSKKRDLLSKICRSVVLRTVGLWW